MEIKVRVEEERDYRRSEEVARAAFGYPERVKRVGIGCPYEHWMVHELRSRDGIAELNRDAVIAFDEEFVKGESA